LLLLISSRIARARTARTASGLHHFPHRRAAPPAPPSQLVAAATPRPAVSYARPGGPPLPTPRRAALPFAPPPPPPPIRPRSAHRFPRVGPLLVVHRHDAADPPRPRPAEERVARPRPAGVDALGPRRLHRRPDQPLLLVAEQAAVAGVWVQGRHAQPRPA